MHDKTFLKLKLPHVPDSLNVWMEDTLGLFPIHSINLTHYEPTKKTCLENIIGKRKRCYVIACISLWVKKTM
jgi:hypothetical protein